ncbi:MAG TPA: putative cytokinetic ring protein SteA [Nocardioides sp.]|nr:putative cytokinetic ring protein SteA [Nocardioides sp.]
MKARTRNAALPGLHGTARVERRTRTLLPRLQPGDIAVVDHLDMDRATAQALVDRGVSAVVNASPAISGRYPNLGPELLAEAGVLLLDRCEGAFDLTDGARIRVHDEVIFVGDRPVGMGREIDLTTIRAEMAQARGGLATQLETFTHNSTEFLRREQDLLLHGEGLPRLHTRVEGRPVVVIVPGQEHRAQLKRLGRFISERRPVLVGVDAGADTLLAAGHRPDVVVLDSMVDESQRPSSRTLRAAREVVLRIDPGARPPVEHLERLGVRPLRLETSAATEDAALLLVHSEDPAVIVGVGLHSSLDEFLDRRRPGLASTYLTRLTVGHRLVDSTAIPTLYSGRVRPRHVFLVLVLGLLALAVAVGITPVGQEWAQQLTDWVQAQGWWG